MGTLDTVFAILEKRASAGEWPKRALRENKVLSKTADGRWAGDGTLSQVS
jgi:hypothetical protein